MQKHNSKDISHHGVYLFMTTLYLATVVHSYPRFKTKIPNADHVIDPCQNGGMWEGVGHKNKEGRGPLNPFGEAWKQNQTWSYVCMLDSDQDGRTNGEELGDPDCTWTEGSNLPVSQNNITHPGICEPIDSENCTEINQWLSCTSMNVWCNGTMEAGVERLELRLNNTEVPTEETTYSCMVFDIPRDKQYDVIAAKPIIGNKNVIHHMVIYGCLTSDIENHNVKPYQLIPKCFMANKSGCKSMVAAFGLWDPALDAFCLPSDVGVRIGEGGYEQLMIQYHWTNFDKSPGQTDTSGIEIFYTPSVREKNSGMLLFGQMKIFLPPKQASILVSGGCQPFCSKERMKGPIQIIESFHHMHKYGVSQKIEVFRNGTKIHTLSDEKDFNYMVPKFYRYFETPVQILPGDYISTTCTYNSMKAEQPVRFGPGTNDEMCFGFIRFYPLSNLPLEEGGCSEYGTVPLCKIHTPAHYTIDGCDVKSVLTEHGVNANNSLLSDIVRHCDSEDKCTPDCLAVQLRMMNDPCFRNDIGFYVKYLLAYWRKWGGVHIIRELGKAKCLDLVTSTPGNGGGHRPHLNSAIFVMLSMVSMVMKLSDIA